MKKYMIFADVNDPKYVFSNCLSRARQYAEEMVRDFEPGTEVHILAHKATARIGLNWGETLPKEKRKRAKKRVDAIASKEVKKAVNGRGGWNARWPEEEDKRLLRLVAEGKNRREITRAFPSRSVHAVRVRMNKLGVALRGIPK